MNERAYDRLHFVPNHWLPNIQHTVKYDKKKIGRNEQCPCGSGKKYKKCCGPKFDNNRCHENNKTLY